MKTNSCSTESADKKECAGSTNLFSPLTLRSITFRNRIGVSPMCQYYSKDGFADDWHLVHLGSRAVGGAGLVIVEASAVEARGRITPDDLGIYKDEHIAKLKQITGFISSFGAVPGIQIAHAGRKASSKNPWKEGNRHDKLAVSNEDGGWDIVGPSAIAFSETSKLPTALSVTEIKEIQQKFVDAAKRSLEAGFTFLEIHAAHGYLLHSFYSPLSNQRSDEYGGSFENRIRFLVETVQAVRKTWPDNLPLSVRLSASDWVEGGWSVDDSVELSKELKKLGVDIIDCSSGNIRSGDRYNMHPAWQVPLAESVRNQAKIPTAAVGMISDSKLANEIITQGKADMVLLARQMMRDPYWPYHAAQELGIEAITIPRNYSYAL
ncbi:MAG: NADH:flavin oxidoreductase/NADH oxidase [Candidatus Obscuribacterales bacterium]|nr:NADH:flavin oxidoreductase/NADH oxidase [Candidatus Obscuribacterales bacterium]